PAHTTPTYPLSLHDALPISKHGSIRQRKWLLNQSFSERTPADQYATIPVLHGSRNNFACRSRGFIKQDDELSFFPSAYAGGIIIDRKSTRLNSSHVAISYAV